MTELTHIFIHHENRIHGTRYQELVEARALDHEWKGEEEPNRLIHADVLGNHVHSARLHLSCQVFAVSPP